MLFYIGYLAVFAPPKTGCQWGVRKPESQRLGAACAELIDQGHYGVMVASRGETAVPVPLEEVAGKLKLVPTDHSWVETARRVGTCLGD